MMWVIVTPVFAGAPHEASVHAASTVSLTTVEVCDARHRGDSCWLRPRTTVKAETAVVRFILNTCRDSRYRDWSRGK
jgi:hypothetical protein